MTHLMVIGAGGNIGSHLVPHLARLPGLTRLTLVDRDRYEERNRANQDLPAGAVGRRKALVQAERARRLNPSLEVRAIAEDVEALPLGALRADLILTGLDSRRARQRVNYAARGLGVPWLDGGVLATGMLVRVSRFAPGSDAACLECRWDDADYAGLEQSYPCEQSPVPARTGAPSALGALAAALLALECGTLLRGEPGGLAPGDELIVDAMHHRQTVTRTRRFGQCRLGDHAPWPLEPVALDRQSSLADLLSRVGERLGANGDLAIAIDGTRIARRLGCERCGTVKRVLRLAGRMRPADRRCSACGGRTVLSGFGLLEWMDAGSLARDERNRPAGTMGLLPGEIIRASGGGRQARFELVASQSSAETPGRRVAELPSRRVPSAERRA